MFDPFCLACHQATAAGRSWMSDWALVAHACPDSNWLAGGCFLTAGGRMQDPPIRKTQKETPFESLQKKAIATFVVVCLRSCD